MQRAREAAEGHVKKGRLKRRNRGPYTYRDFRARKGVAVIATSLSFASYATGCAATCPLAKPNLSRPISGALWEMAGTNAVETAGRARRSTQHWVLRGLLSERIGMLWINVLNNDRAFGIALEFRDKRYEMNRNWLSSTFIPTIGEGRWGRGRRDFVVCWATGA